MKQTTAPHLPILDKTTDPGQICNILKIRGKKIKIGTVDWPDKASYAPDTYVYLAHSGTAIYLLYDVAELGVKAENTENQSAVSKDSCVEFFVDPQSDGHYWNLEFNCIGAVNASHRRERNNKTPLTDAEISTIRRYCSLGHKTFAERKGLTHWQLLAVIPFNLLGIEYQGSAYPIRCNFNKCASASSHPHFLTWNPIEIPNPDFHRPDFFGELILE